MNELLEASECAASAEAAPNPSFPVLGVRVDAVQIPEVIAEIERWIEQRGGCRWVAVTGMHGVSEARRDPSFLSVLRSAHLVVPDGMPLVWLARAHGFRLRERVCGPDLMRSFLSQTVPTGYRHFFYGGDTGVAQTLAESLTKAHPGLIVAGVYSPPYRPLTPGEEIGVARMLEKANPDIVWVGLSTPKQERWMASFCHRLEVPVLIGVGAAFDFLSGRKRRAPLWMQSWGLEWLYRFAQEPRRLWRRYLVDGARFAVFASLELAGLWRPRSSARR